MHYVFQVSKTGYDIKTKKYTPPQEGNTKESVTAGILEMLAYPHIIGAHLQLKRYEQAVNQLNKKTAAHGTIICFLESASLFENLATISIYLEYCGTKHKMHPLFQDIRNHIRHDIRENFIEEDARERNRRGRLKIDKHLQFSIGFSKDAIKVGGIMLTLKDINDYIEWANKEIGKVLSEAKRQGRLKRQ